MALSSVLKGLMRHCLPGYAQNPQTRLWYEINADDGNGSHNLDHEHVNGALPHDDVHEGEPSMAGVLSTEGASQSWLRPLPPHELSFVPEPFT